MPDSLAIVSPKLDLPRHAFPSRLEPLPEDYQIFPFGIVASAFDMLHAGHVLMLEDAKRLCGYLFVGLQDDPSTTPASYRGKQKNKPIQDREMRFIQLEPHIRGHGEIFRYNTEKQLRVRIEKIAALGPHIRVLGSDWEGKYATGQELATLRYYHRRNHPWSSTYMREELAKQMGIPAAA